MNLKVQGGKSHCTALLKLHILSQTKFLSHVTAVLAQFLVALNKFCFDEYGMRYRVEDYSEYVFAKIWGCDQTESNRIVHEFFKSRHFAEEIPPIPGAFESLQNISEYHRRLFSLALSLALLCI